MSNVIQTTLCPFGAEMQERLTAWVDGELVPEEADAVRAHLAECAFCRAEYAGIAATRALAAEWTIPPAGDPWPALRQEIELSAVWDELQRLRAETQALRDEVARLRQERALPCSPSAPRGLFPYSPATSAPAHGIV